MKTFTRIALTAAVLAFAGCSPKPTQEAQAAAAPAGAAPEPAPDEAAPPRPGCTQSFTAFDTNGDQRVSRLEFLERPHAHPEPDALFESRDSDRDGALTSAEFCSGWHGPMAGLPGRGPAGGGGVSQGPCAGPGTGSCVEPGMGMGPGARPGVSLGRGGAGMGMGRGGGSRCEAHFARFDVNADGNVSGAELAALPHPHGDAQVILAARDQDHDGRLTKAEFCAPWSPPRSSP